MDGRNVGEMPRRFECLSDGSAIGNGWVSTQTADGVAVHAHLGVHEGRVVVTGVLVEADEVTTDVLRQVQTARILAKVAADDVVLAGGNHSSIVMSGETLALLEAVGPADAELTLGQLRSRSPVTVKGGRRRRLGRPDGNDPEGFYRRVATTYRSAAVDSRQPAVVIAEENDVPVETVRRWIKEARRRGFLPPGRKGRAG